MRQQTVAEESFEKFHKKTRKEQFLDEMERIIPWRETLCAKMRSFGAKSGHRIV